MTLPLLDSLLQSPALPELLQQAQDALAREHRLRQKFYEDITPDHKWEFIQGQIVMHSPALNRHLLATKNLYDAMSAHARVWNLGVVYVEKAMTSFPRNDYEPDIFFLNAAKAALLGPDTLRFPVPDLIVEVLSPSTEKNDRGVKFVDYALHGVREYWIVDPETETVELHRLEGEAYPAAQPMKDGVLSSEVVAGFEIPVRAVFSEEENARLLRRICSEAK